MNDKLLLDMVKKIIKEILFQNSILLYHIRWENKDGDKVMQIYLTGDNKKVSVGDCAKINRYIVNTFDEKEIERTFSIEVGTAGTERELFTMDHFRDSIGETVLIATDQKVDGSNKFEGVIENIKGDQIVIKSAEKIYIIPAKIVRNAHVIDTADKELSTL